MESVELALGVLALCAPAATTFLGPVTGRRASASSEAPNAASRHVEVKQRPAEDMLVIEIVLKDHSSKEY